MTQRLFVYGTLAPGRANAHVLAGIPGTWQPATVRGTLLPHGWGAALGYPGLILDQGGVEVRGLVFSSGCLADLWPRIDDFEGDGYERVQTLVRLQDGSAVEAFVYCLSARSRP